MLTRTCLTLHTTSLHLKRRIYRIYPLHRKHLGLSFLPLGGLRPWVEAQPLLLPLAPAEPVSDIHGAVNASFVG